WIVKYMVENTMGKIYLDYAPDSVLKKDLKYLIENENDKDSKPIISDITELTLIDPACGSGHILVTGFELLFLIYREEGYTAKQAVDSILKSNIYGLDIDDRAMQLARFAVLLKAAQFDANVLNRGIIPNIFSFPEATLANSFTEEYYSKEQSDWYELKGMKLKRMIALNWTEKVIDPKTKKEKEVAKSVVYREGTILCNEVIDQLVQHCEESILVDYSADLENFWGTDKFGYAYSEFFYAIQLLQQGKNLGSAIKLKLSEEALKHTLQKFQEWNERDAKLQLGAFDKVLWENLKPHLNVLFVLTKRYAAVVANPPYMGQKNMNVELRDYTQNVYPNSKHDLYAVFIEAMSKMLCPSARVGCITMESWMFLSSYEKLRKYLIDKYSIVGLAHLGWHIIGIAFGTAALIFEKSKKIKNGEYSFLTINDIDKNNNTPYVFPKLDNGRYNKIPQSAFSKIPGNPIVYWIGKKMLDSFGRGNVGELVQSKAGVVTGNDSLFIRLWHEIALDRISFNEKDFEQKANKDYVPLCKGGLQRKYYGNYEHVIHINNIWTEGKTTKSVRRGDPDYYFKRAISWSYVSSSNNYSFRLCDNAVFSTASPAFYLNDKYLMSCLLGFLNSKISNFILKALNPTINLPTGYVESLPFLVNKEVVVQFDPIINNQLDISKRDWDSYETSWDFEKSPLLNDQNSLLEGFKLWSRNVKEDFFKLHANEEELNRIFIDIYGLQDELTSDVALRDITILQDELDRNALDALEPVFRDKGKDAIELPIDKTEILSQFVSYAIGVLLGRYRLDKPGLNIAHPNPTDEETAAYKYNGHTIKIDEDGILPLMGDDCAFPDDALVRTKDLILAIWGENTLTDNINFLHDCLGMDLNKWLTEKFWGYHTSMYKKKPIYWLFSSNVNKPQNAAFKVLVYMHRMDKYTVQKIQRNYLHPHQEYIKRETGKLEENELSLTRDELKKLEKLRNWEIECRDYNEVLKELANQQIEFDLDDGVDVNYAKFEGAVAKI
ncbi:MAG TPA: BREX-1 system adenine-specific DNA-methyltransferase PglX, partial [Marinilabiliaceae bacterium]|nr:BREX-1 system adenine-specific DNA-methyltransferase PglX [Marinilabiliaceae bacterium]